MNFKYLYYWYKFLYLKQRTNLCIFLIIIFVLPVLPYLIVSFKLFYFGEEQMRLFYGDGSIILLCSGILCSFISILFEHRDEIEKKRNTLMNLGMIVFYVIITVIFIDCQLNFDRKWPFIFIIFLITSIIFLITMLVALYLNFKVNVNYNDVIKLIQESETKKIARKADTSKKSKSGIKV